MLAEYPKIRTLTDGYRTCEIIIKQFIVNGALIRDLGVVLSELYWLDDLADDSAKDGQHTFFFTAAPLKIKGGSGSPVNPMIIK
jgi:hypothetical protein